MIVEWRQIEDEEEKDAGYLRFQRDRAPPDVMVLNTAGWDGDTVRHTLQHTCITKKKKA